MVLKVDGMGLDGSLGGVRYRAPNAANNVKTPIFIIIKLTATVIITTEAIVVAIHPFLVSHMVKQPGYITEVIYTCVTLPCNISTAEHSQYW